MNKTVVSTPKAPAAIGPYSQAIKSEPFVFCSGQLGLDPATGELASGVKAQTERAMKNIAAFAETLGLSMGHIIKTTIFLTNMGDFSVVNDVYGSYFADCDKPARSTVAVAALPKGGLVEIEVLFTTK